ncbi:MAG: hypothetical protein U5J63_12195 [Fodinibius sp.]|nr:hypothetical protein [Fodinibius sp.]
MASPPVTLAGTIPQYQVETDGGPLTVYFDYDTSSNKYTNIKLEGPAHFVFEGSYQLVTFFCYSLSFWGMGMCAR